MKNKKLLVSLVIVAIVVTIVVVSVSITVVRDDVYFSYYSFDSNPTTIPEEGAVPTELITKIAKGKSIVFLSKDSFLAELNAQLREQYPNWHAFDVKKVFPNVLNVCLGEVKAIAKMTTTKGIVYLDSFGCQIVQAPDYDCVDITSAFNSTEIVSEANQPIDGTFKFASEESNMRLQYVLEAIMATWESEIEVEEMADFFNAEKPFEFENNETLLIRIRQGGMIKLLSPGSTDPDLAERLQKAYGVYYNSKVNLQGDDWVITVDKNGNIKTPDPNK